MIARENLIEKADERLPERVGSAEGPGANTPAIITDISAEPIGDAAANTDATALPTGTCNNSPTANNRRRGLIFATYFSAGREDRAARGRWP
jgi:hypothetical protein